MSAPGRPERSRRLDATARIAVGAPLSALLSLTDLHARYGDSHVLRGVSFMAGESAALDTQGKALAKHLGV